ncbi:MAG: polysaccharide biosynthesis tyrosine autokinase [Elusimicrobiota bacterium]
MADYELNLHDYWRIIKKRKLLVSFIFGLVLVSTIVFTNLQSPVYQAKAVIKLDQPRDLSAYGQVDLWTLINTEVRVIKSESIVRQTALRLNWIQEDSSNAEIAEKVNSIISGVQVDKIGDSNLIQISVNSDKAPKAALIANTLVDVYVKKGAKEYSLLKREKRDYIGKQLEQIRTKLQKAEEEKKVYIEKNGTSGMGSYWANKLSDLRTQKANIIKKYTAQHPEVIKVQQQIKYAENEQSRLPKTELELARLSRELRINEELYTLLSKRYKEAEIDAADEFRMASPVSGAVEPIRPIRPNKQLNLLVGLMLGLFLGLIFAFILENLDTSIGTIEDVEAFLKIPVLGVIPHIGPAERYNLFGKIFAGSHQNKIENIRQHLIIHHNSKSPYMEAYHTLRANLKFATFLGKGKTVAFTSAGVEEGKTLTATNFSLAAAASGLRVVLVEGDLRRPAVGRILGVKSDCGLTDIVLGTVSWREALKGTPDFLMGGLKIEQVIKTMSLENLSVITVGFIPPNPGDVLGSVQMQNLIKSLKEEFDLVVLDCPPVLLFADALLVGAKVDGVVLVYKVGRMARGVLRRAKTQLDGAQAKILGVVLNDLKVSEMSSRYGYYYSNKYYSDKDENKSQEKKRAAAFSPDKFNVS